MAGYAKMKECDIRKCAHLSAKMQIQQRSHFARLQKRWFGVHQMAGYEKVTKRNIEKSEYLSAKTPNSNKGRIREHLKTEGFWGVTAENIKKLKENQRISRSPR